MSNKIKPVNITVDEKKDICRRFVTDVLKKRAQKLDTEQYKVFQKLSNAALPKPVVDLVNKVYDMYKGNEQILDMLGVEVNSWIMNNEPLITEVPYESNMCLSPWVNEDDLGLKKDRVLKLPYPVRLDVDDWMWRLDPPRSDKSPNAVKFHELEAAEKKLKEDAKKLFEVAYQSIARKRTFEAIENNCPELAPYIKELDDSTPCPAHLADLASCMRVKDDC